MARKRHRVLGAIKFIFVLLFRIVKLLARGCWFLLKGIYRLIAWLFSLLRGMREKGRKAAIEKSRLSPCSDHRAADILPAGDRKDQDRKA